MGLKLPRDEQDSIDYTLRFYDTYFAMARVPNYQLLVFVERLGWVHQEYYNANAEMNRLKGVPC